MPQTSVMLGLMTNCREAILARKIQYTTLEVGVKVPWHLLTSGSAGRTKVTSFFCKCLLIYKSSLLFLKSYCYFVCADSRWYDLRASFQQKFEEAALKLQKRANVSTAEGRMVTQLLEDIDMSDIVRTRWKLAAAVYEVSYMGVAGKDRSAICGKPGKIAVAQRSNGICKSSTSSRVMSKATAMPWLLCGEYLNHIKRRALQVAVQSLLE